MEVDSSKVQKKFAGTLAAHPSPSSSDITFQKFGLPASENKIQDYACALQKKLLRQGKIFLTQHYICFYSSIFGQRIKLIIPFLEVANMKKTCDPVTGLISNAIEITTRDLRQYLFASFISRDDAYNLMVELWRGAHLEGVMQWKEAYATDESASSSPEEGEGENNLTREDKAHVRPWKLTLHVCEAMGLLGIDPTTLPTGDDEPAKPSTAAERAPMLLSTSEDGILMKESKEKRLAADEETRGGKGRNDDAATSADVGQGDKLEPRGDHLVEKRTKRENSGSHYFLHVEAVGQSFFSKPAVPLPLRFKALHTAMARLPVSEALSSDASDGELSIVGDGAVLEKARDLKARAHSATDDSAPAAPGEGKQALEAKGGNGDVAG
eukprot:Rmarinus@m.23911